MSRKRETASSLIAERLEFATRYVRSFEIERDLADPAAIEGYVLTPTVLFAAQTLAAGLRRESTQRAWRVTGPYGAGKSAFGLFLCHLASRSAVGKQLQERIEAQAPDVAWQRVPRYLPVPITGSRMPFGAALVARLRRAVESMSTRRPPKILIELGKLESRAATQPLSDEHVLRALLGFVDYAASPSQGGHDGVLLVVDEMGKFLEHAALRPDHADAHLFQRIAEMAAGSSKLPFAVVGFLHQNFADYAAGYGERVQEEWAKVAQRFEDIPFDESLEQYGFLLASAMQYKHDVLKNLGIEARSQQLYAQLLKGEEHRSGRAHALLGASSNLYPIHPATFVALATAVKRFGQNQRSLFSFLLAGEAHGLQHFIHSTTLDARRWYRLSELYSYLASLDGITFRQGDRARKWELLKETLAHGPALEPLEQDVVKAVGLLNVLDPVPFIRSDAAGITFALADSEGAEDVNAALKRLVERKVLYYRTAQRDYCIWKHSSVDLETLREEAGNAVRPTATLDGLLEAIGQGRALIAHRHYQTTGTLRAFRVRYVSIAQLSALKSADISDYDGEICVVLLEPGASIAKARAEVAGSAPARHPTRIIALRKIEADDLRLATDIRIWKRIKETCQELRVDEFARREVAQELDQAERRLEERLSALASFDDDENAVAWLHDAKPARIPSRMALSRFLSDLCDRIYSAAPIVQNELINRHKLNSAAALARQRLVTAMLGAERDKDLGLKGNPPERTMYLSLFFDSGMHRQERGEFAFGAPRYGADKRRWLPVWEGLRAYLADQGNVGFDKVLAFLRAAPFGLREGPALLFLVAFILNERRRIALFERNTYVVGFTDDHFMRLAKSPANFALHLQPEMGGVDGLFRLYANAMATIGGQPESLKDPHAIVSCLYKWYSELPQFALQTARLSGRAKEVRGVLKRAGDPMDLLSTGLPKACGFGDLRKRKGAKADLAKFGVALRGTLTEIGGALCALRGEILSTLNVAFRTSGTVQQLREYLENNFAAYREILGDYKLKAALARSLDHALPDEAWIDSMGALLGERTLELWSDETIGKFRAESMVFAGQLKRWAALMLEHRDKKVGTGSLVRIHVTAASGKEHTLLVNKETGVTADEMKKAIRRVIELNPQEAPLALAEALAELLGSADANEKAKNAKDR